MMIAQHNNKGRLRRCELSTIWATTKSIQMCESNNIQFFVRAAVHGFERAFSAAAYTSALLTELFGELLVHLQVLLPNRRSLPRKDLLEVGL